MPMRIGIGPRALCPLVSNKALIGAIQASKSVVSAELAVAYETNAQMLTLAWLRFDRRRAYAREGDGPGMCCEWAG